MTRRVFFVLFPGVELLDFAGPIQTFHQANQLGGQFEIHYCGPDGGATTAQGLSFNKLEPFSPVNQADWVFVSGYPILAMPSPLTTVDWVRRAHQSGALILSVCSGVFILGEAGLLDGKQCTAHWSQTGLLKQRFPKAHVLEDKLFVDAASIISSGGLASGVDMTLAILEKELGPVFVAKVARELVVYMRRDGNHKQSSVYLDYRTHLQPGIHAVQDHIVTDPGATTKLEELAKIAGVSERHLTRLFKQSTGITLNEYRTKIRLERAMTLLRNPQLTLESVAEKCGFSDSRHLRRLWKTTYGTSARIGERGRPKSFNSLAS
jgi:transcriptional regulator GlxA family with amidase domain